ncbi:MAG: hypothetical protein ACK452_06340 [Bacteroidota bacterium]|jgi:hypothetical protein
MVFIAGFIGMFIGRLIIGSILNFILKPEERDNPNPENSLGWIGAIIGGAAAMIITALMK